MRGRIFTLALGLAFLAAGNSLTASEVGFPYVARVKGTRASVRSGPGRQHYVCLALSRGETVEVFCKQGDWLGIRPPDSCFSLVAKKNVQRLEDDGLGEVTRPKTISWIGSDRDPSSSGVPEFVWQVSLEPGEIVEILGEEMVSPTGEGPKTAHLRVAPPSGEFRWIRSNEMEIDPEWNVVEESGRNEEVDDSISEQVSRLRVAASESAEMAVSADVPSDKATEPGTRIL